MIPAAVMFAAAVSLQPLSIAAAMAQHRSLNWKRVRVEGWISGCYELSCVLFARPNFGHRIDFSIRSISIGPSAEFDALSRRFAHRHVVVEATFNGRFIDERTIRGHHVGPFETCNDRCDTLHAPKLVKVLP